MKLDSISSKAVLPLAALVVLLFLYVYPGVWRYTYYSNGNTRIDRLTGAKQSMNPTGRWAPWGQAADVDEALPASELANLQGVPHIEGNTFTINLYNGSKWTVSQVTIRLTATKPDILRDAGLHSPNPVVVLARDYALKPSYGDCRPLSSGDFAATLDEETTAAWTNDPKKKWTLISARGHEQQ